MASSTVAYTDTTGNKDYLGMIAGQIGRRLKEASDMASNERAYAEDQAEKGGTSLSEAGIGRGYFFKRALGSRFGGDAIARTKGRMGIGGAGTDPTGNFRSRFRGGFDYNVTNELSSMPVSNALTAGLRGVESGLVAISQSLNSLARGMEGLARGQEDLAKQAILNGAFMQAFLNHMQREAARQRARSEERGLETRRLLGGGGADRNMINITPSGRKTGSGFLKGADTFQTGIKAGTNKKTPKLLKTVGAATGLKSGKTITKKLAQVGGKTAPKLLASTTKVTGDAIPIAKVISAGIKASDTDAVKAFAKSGVTGGGKNIKNIQGMKALQTAMQEADADFFAMNMKELGNEDFIENVVSGKTARIQNADDAYRAMAAYKNGSLDGVARNTDEAIAMFKMTYGPGEYAKYFGKNASKPLKTAVKNTVTKKIVDEAAEKAAKITAKSIGKSIWKKIPILAGIAGIGFGIQRALEGDLLGAGLEITSGLMGATGVAAKGSLAIDGYLLARDLGLTPLADGGITKRPIVGEAGPEAVLPLTGAKGKRTFKMFGEGTLDARLDNESKDSKLQALGHKTYYETMGGWEAFGKGLLKAFGGMKDDVVDFLNPFKDFKREKKPGEGKNQWWDFMDVFPNPQVSNPNNSNEIANLLNNSSAQTSLGNMFVSPTIVNNYNTFAAGGNGESGEVGSGAFPYSFTAFNADFSLMSKT